MVEIKGENVCCSHIEVIDCGDTKEHKHIICDSMAIVSNEMVKEYCLGNWGKCIGFQMASTTKVGGKG